MSESKRRKVAEFNAANVLAAAAAVCTAYAEWKSDGSDPYSFPEAEIRNLAAVLLAFAEGQQ